MKANPVFWLMWLLPAAAVCASFATLAIAISGADRPLPKSYHREGAGLDVDFARARRAAELGLHATLELRAAEGQCVVTLRGDAPPSPVLRLLLTRSNDASLDRQLLLKRSESGDFRSPCVSLPAGKWRIALDDDSAGWSIRTRLDGALAHVEFQARDPAGPGT